MDFTTRASDADNVRALIAGGGGFIGSHLADLLLGRGDEVVVIDSFLTGRRSNLSNSREWSGFRLVEHDVTEPLPDLGDFDAVLNLASPASPDDFARFPLEILSVGSTGTRHLLELAGDQGARFLQASTSEVYGDPLVHPQAENYFGNVDPVGPRSCYDEAKRFGEAVVSAHRRVHDTDTTIARIFNTYGERMTPDDGRVVTAFVSQAIRGEPLTVYGDGFQTRSFCYVSDQVAGLVALLDSDLAGPVNIGNPSEITMWDLAETIIDLTNSTSTVVTAPLPPEREGDPSRRCPDITVANTALNWQPLVSLRDGLADMISHFRFVEFVG
jgi:nucleoside-diphosphate-sugar epimerase